MKIFKKILICLLLFSEIKTNAQDIHFTNFLSAPQILNPANTGNDPGKFRIQTNRRNQGDQMLNSYITTALSFDMPIYYYSEKAAIGFIYINDKSSDKTLISNQFYLTSGYFRKITKHTYLHIGFQVGYVLKRYSLSGLTFPDQFDMSSGYFNSNLPSGENYNSVHTVYFDLNWGLMWSVKKEKFNSEIGFAMFHYNKPDQSFYGINDKLPPRCTLHAFCTVIFAQKRYIKPKLLSTFQNRAHEILAGFDLGSKTENDFLKDVRIGCGYRGGLNRISDAVEFNIGAVYKNFNISLVFDFDASNQNSDKIGRKSVELCISYICPDFSIKSRTLPCEIY